MQANRPDHSLKLAHSLAYYLPQYHTIPENDLWWGDGFTEWTRLRQARNWHKDQVIQTPGDLGYYELTSTEIMGRQYRLARENSISSFAFWHYWFGGGDVLLEKPAERLLRSDEIVQFCFAWANHNWVKTSTGKILKRQNYDTRAERQFAYLEPFFHDPRYTRINGQPVFTIFSPKRHPHLALYIDEMQTLAQKSGLPGLCFLFDHCDATSAESKRAQYHFNSNRTLKFEPSWKRGAEKIGRKLFFGAKRPRFGNFQHCVDKLNKHVAAESRELPIVLPGWDTTIRHGPAGLCLLNATPAQFQRQLDRIAQLLAKRPRHERILVVKSWNEWAEGNIMEPSAQYGDVFLRKFSQRFHLDASGDELSPC